MPPTVALGLTRDGRQRQGAPECAATSPEPRSLRGRLRAIAAHRPPDFVIGGDADPYLRRWWVIPRNRWFNIYLHQFVRSDDDRALHDHPWLFNASWLLDGDYVEHTSRGPRFVAEGRFKFRPGPSPHRVELLADDAGERPVWTLFITGPVVRQWGFLCPKGWRHWKEFVAPGSGDGTGSSVIGKGCE